MGRTPREMLIRTLPHLAMGALTLSFRFAVAHDRQKCESTRRTQGLLANEQKKRGSCRLGALGEIRLFALHFFSSDRRTSARDDDRFGSCRDQLTRR